MTNPTGNLPAAKIPYNLNSTALIKLKTGFELQTNGTNWQITSIGTNARNFILPAWLGVHSCHSLAAVAGAWRPGCQSTWSTKLTKPCTILGEPSTFSLSRKQKVKKIIKYMQNTSMPSLVGKIWCWWKVIFLWCKLGRPADSRPLPQS